MAPSDLPSSSKTRKSSAYDANFALLLLDLGARVDFVALDVEPPSNFDEIVDTLKGTLVPVSTINYKSFQVEKVKAYGETKTAVSLLPLLLGEDDHFASDHDRAFTNIIPLVEGIVTCKPDLYDGLCPSKVDPRVRKDLDSLIVPSRQSMAPIAPNFFLELKGQDGSYAVAGRQAWHDGIVGARAMQAIRCYDIETTLDHKAYSLSASFYDTTIKIYSTHPVMRDGKVVYNTVQVFSCLMDNDITFHQGVSAVRNARVWAENKRISLISEANARLLSSLNKGMTTSMSDTHTPSPVKRHLESSALLPNKRPKLFSPNTSISTSQSTTEQTAWSSTLSIGHSTSTELTSTSNEQTRSSTLSVGHSTTPPRDHPLNNKPTTLPPTKNLPVDSHSAPDLLDYRTDESVPAADRQ